MILYFQLQGFPRSITRRQWRDIWRWKRIETKRLELEGQRRVELLKANLPHYVREDIVSQMINPPLLVHDLQGLT